MHRLTPLAVRLQRPSPLKPNYRWQGPPYGGAGQPGRQCPPTTTLCDSCRLPTRRGTKPLACDAPNCQAKVQAARRCSGAAVLPPSKEATVGVPDDPVFTHTSKVRGAELAYSYEEEKSTLLLALEWARANCISICSDSQALLKVI